MVLSSALPKKIVFFKLKPSGAPLVVERKVGAHAADLAAGSSADVDACVGGLVLN